MDTAGPAVAARTFRLDVKGAEVRVAFGEHGIRSVLLKGRAFAHLLYDDCDPREYSDVDLLVSPDDVPCARQVLNTLGFKPWHGSAPIDLSTRALAEGSLHGGTWYRERDAMSIDLHHTLPQVGADPRLVWREIARHTIAHDVGGISTEILDRTASALLVALHAAHHGPDFPSALEDLRRATDRFEPGCWRLARDLATTLDARGAMGTGLGLTPEGRAIAQRLGLSTAPSLGFRLRWSNAPWGSNFIECLAAQSSTRERVLLMAWLIWPTPAALRLGSPLARRGRSGLVAAYAIRPLQLLRRAPAALLAWSRLRRSG